MANKSRIRVLLTDDKNNGGSALRSVLEREPDMELIGEAEDGAACMRLAGVLKPDVVAMVLDMFDREGMEITRQIIAANPDVKVLAISPYYDNWFVVRAMLRCGYMLTDCAFEELAHAIRAAASSHAHASPGTAGIAMEMPRQ
ncbi:MAG: response regulator transcription factor [Candidatus Sumerlaeota bacterium]|nr:response regulator transcription factor [Candidatus Sumerlaeota bacterium]